MPKSTNYETNEIIFYKFCCKNDNILNCYVGHTSNFNRRKSEHKSRCNNEKDKKYNFKLYQLIRENGGFDNWRMIEIHKQFCKDKRECERVEQGLIEQNVSDMNTRKSYSFDNDYYKQLLQIDEEMNKQLSLITVE